MMLNSAAALTEQTVAWSTTDKQSNIALSNGNRDAGVSSSFSFPAVRADRGNNAGKRYFEISMPTVPGSHRMGFADKDFLLTTYLGNARISVGAIAGGVNIHGGGVAPQMAISTAITPPSEANGDYYMFAIDFATGKAWLGKNNSWLGSGNPSSGANPWIVGVPGAMWPACSLFNQGTARLHSRLSEFQGTVPSGFSSWALGTHDPSGFAMVGDSITHLYLTTDDWRTLTGYGTAMGYGIPSNTTTQMLARFDNILLAKPKAAFIMGGVNDLATGIGTSTTQSNIAAMIAKCLAASVVPYVEAVLRVGAAYVPVGNVNNTNIATLNTAIQSTVASSGGNWLNWPAVTPLTDPSDYAGDGIHLSHAGNVKRVAALASYLALYG